jgi:hypothetical protein
MGGQAIAVAFLVLRLGTAGQISQPNDSRRRNLPFVILRGDRPLYLQQLPRSSE